MKTSDPDAPKKIDAMIDALDGWRGDVARELRELIGRASPDLREDWKWGTAVWTLNGVVVSIGAFKEHVKLLFFKGASLEVPEGSFNSGSDAKTTRAIDFFEGDKIDAARIKRLVKAAATYDAAAKKKR